MGTIDSWGAENVQFLDPHFPWGQLFLWIHTAYMLNPDVDKRFLLGAFVQGEDPVIEREFSFLIFHAAHNSIISCDVFSLQKRKRWTDFPQQRILISSRMGGNEGFSSHVETKICSVRNPLIAQTSPWKTSWIGTLHLEAKNYQVKQCRPPVHRNGKKKKGKHEMVSIFNARQCRSISSSGGIATHDIKFSESLKHRPRCSEFGLWKLYIENSRPYKFYYITIKKNII